MADQPEPQGQPQAAPAAERPSTPAPPQPPAPTAALVPAATALATQRAGTMQQAFQGLMPTSIGEAFTLAGYLAKSNAIPKSMRAGQRGGGPESVLTVILAGMELGLTPIRALQSITNISGTLAMRADLQLALARKGGVLVFYDEGYEVKGKTDANLKRRLELAHPKLDPDHVELAYEKILAAIQDMPAGKPYAWAFGQRVGDPAPHLRTFTWADAEVAFTYDEDPEKPDGPKVKKPLSQKFNYQAFPGDMYPKRARTRLLQILGSDVLAGLPAVEALEGGQAFIEAESVTDGPSDADNLLAEIEADDPEMATTIRNGFTQLRMGTAKQLQKLVQFRDKPADLVEWLKNEWAARHGRERKREDVLGGDGQQQPAPAGTSQPAPVQDGQVIEDPKPAAGGTNPPPAETKPAPAEAERPAADTKPPAPETPPAGKGSKARDLADRFKRGVTF